MTDKHHGTPPGVAERAARAQLQAENRVLLQASVAAAKKSAHSTDRHKSKGGSEVLTAFVVAAVVIGMLALVLRFGS